MHCEGRSSIVFTFEEFQNNHLHLLRQWLNADHIKDHWQETEDDEKLKKKFIEELPLRGVSAFIILKNKTPIGYIQYYDAKRVGGGWWEQESPGTFGIDLMIGMVEFHGRGLGAQIIKEFVSFVRSKEPFLKTIIIDPDPKNFRAVRAFEKAGFVAESEVQTPVGTALLMRMKFED